MVYYGNALQTDAVSPAAWAQSRKTAGKEYKHTTMNKKEISEIKKQYTPKHCAITRICGCYVNAEKEKLASFSQAFLPLPEEEMYKYFELLRKALSGTIGKTLHTLEFPLMSEEAVLRTTSGSLPDAVSDAASNAESTSVTDTGSDRSPAPEEETPTLPEQAFTPQEFLLALRDSSLEDDMLLNRYYDSVISSFDYAENYLILLVNASYDIPGRASDNLDMDDASDEVYHYIHSCICPVNLAKPALSYDAAEGCFRNRERDWIVDPPAVGILFPAFNDRSSDIYSMLYYVKNAKEMHSELTDSILGCPLPLSAPSQKEVFTEIIEETLGDECDYETVRNLHDQLHELTQAAKESPDPVILSQGEVKNLLGASGVAPEQLEDFGTCYEEKTGSSCATFAAANIASESRYQVSTPDVEIRVSPDRSDLVEKKVIDGRPCLVIPITDEIHVNGIKVKI